MKKAVNETLYANQFVPLWEDVTLQEKFEREGNLASKLTGGGIIHFNLGEKVTPKQSYNIIEGAMHAGCEHFALNPVYSICDKGHYTFGKHTTCPQCMREDGLSVPVVDYISRTVGFFTRVSGWSKEKKEGDFEKRNYRATGF